MSTKRAALSRSFVSRSVLLPRPPADRAAVASPPTTPTTAVNTMASKRTTPVCAFPLPPTSSRGGAQPRPFLPSSSQEEMSARSIGQIPVSPIVLEVEPWNSARHISKVGEAWEECGRRVPGFLKEGARSEPRLLVQQQIFRLGEQLNDPTARTPWKSYPEVKRGVEGVVDKLAATRRYERKFGLHQQQADGGSQKLRPGDGGDGASSPGTARDGTAAPAAGVVEPTKTNLATVETAHASREQPPTAQQRQQQGPEKPEKSYILRLSLLLNRGGAGVYYGSSLLAVRTDACSFDYRVA